MLLQAESERTRKALHKAEHDVERLRRALDRSEEQHRSAETRAAAATQSLQVCCCPVTPSSACEGHGRLHLPLDLAWSAPVNGPGSVCCWQQALLRSTFLAPLSSFKNHLVA